MNNALLELTTAYLTGNEPLCKLLTLVASCINDDSDFPSDRLIGDWECAVAGQKVKVVWTDPYREEDGYIFFLPGLASTDVFQGGVIHIPGDFGAEQKWFALKHLAMFADTIELMPNL